MLKKRYRIVSKAKNSTFWNEVAYEVHSSWFNFKFGLYSIEFTTKDQRAAEERFTILVEGRDKDVILRISE